MVLRVNVVWLTVVQLTVIQLTVIRVHVDNLTMGETVLLPVPGCVLPALL